MLNRKTYSRGSKELTYNRLYNSGSVLILYKSGWHLLRNMDNSPFPLTDEHIGFFDRHGYLIVRGFFSPEDTTKLQQWAQEVHDLPRDGDVPWMPYEVSMKTPLEYSVSTREN